MADPYLSRTERLDFPHEAHITLPSLGNGLLAYRVHTDRIFCRREKNLLIRCVNMANHYYGGLYSDCCGAIIGHGTSK